MGKKNRNHNTEIHIPDGIMTESFQKYVKKHPSDDDIIIFLSVQNADWLARHPNDPCDCTDQEADELIEFYFFFSTEYEERTRRKRLENWGQEPLIFRVADAILDRQEQIFETMVEDFLEQVPENSKTLREAKSLCEILFNIREDREISIYLPKESAVMFFSRTIPKEDLEKAKRHMLYLCARTIRERGALAVRLYLRNNTMHLFGVKTAGNGTWQPVPAQTMKEAHCLMPDGTVIPPEEGLVYTEIKRQADIIPFPGKRK